MTEYIMTEEQKRTILAKLDHLQAAVTQLEADAALGRLVRMLPVCCDLRRISVELWDSAYMRNTGQEIVYPAVATPEEAVLYAIDVPIYPEHQEPTP